MKRMLLLLLAISLVIGCGGAGMQRASGSVDFTASKYTGTITPGTWVHEQIRYKYDGEEALVNLQIYFPKNYTLRKTYRTVIMLHGYRGSQRDWPANSSIVSLAELYSMAIVCPSMGSTLYESVYFPETTNKWGPMPGGLFVSNVLVPYLQKTFYLATKENYTGIMGNSTGGRGAILAAERNPNMFGATAGISGDYDPVSMPRNRLHASVYGPYKDFPERWQKIDNPMELAERLKGTPIFLGHGDKDSVVPKEQSLIFVVRLNQLEKDGGKYIKVNKVYPYRMHNWELWSKSLHDVMRFFDEKLEK